MFEIHEFKESSNEFVEISGIPVQYEKFRLIVKGKNNKIIIKENVKFGRVVIDIRGDNNTVVFEDDTVLRGKFLVENQSKITIGKKTIFNFNTSEIEARESTNVLVGENCLFSHFRLQTSDVHSIFDLTSRERTNPAKDIIIGDHVWIAFDAIICKGSSIGKNSVIGARALVSGKFPESCVIAGNPARIVKANITWDSKTMQKLPDNF